MHPTCSLVCSPRLTAATTNGDMLPMHVQCRYKKRQESNIMQELKAAFDVRFIKPHIHTHASTSPAAHTCSGLRAQSAA